MMNKKINNVRLIAMENDDSSFEIYVDYSGNREYLMHHRRNDRIFSVLRTGLTVDALERYKKKMKSEVSLTGKRFVRSDVNPRLKVRKNESRRLEKSIDYIIGVANDYLSRSMLVA